jgi:hypothetical protein
MLLELEPGHSPTKQVRSGPAGHLRTAMLQLAEDKAEILSHSEKAWASVTFSGTRHRIELRFCGAEAVEAGESLIAVLPEHEFAIPGQLVADAAVTDVEHKLLPEPELRVTAELLLLDEA